MLPIGRTRRMKDVDVSYNFNLAKVLSILMVVAGHYFGGILWIPTTFALFVFAFSSGYFTSRKYQADFSLKRFWEAKIVRLSYPILVIDAFLLALFLFRGESGLSSWQTIPALLGLSGFLTWFGLGNPSPFGAGLWFFTLLLIFYAVYPLLARINSRRPLALAFLLGCLMAASILHYRVEVGHSLWLTAFAFVLGAYAGRYGIGIGPKWGIALVFPACALLVGLNWGLGFNLLNYFFILIASFGIVVFLLGGRLPKRFFGKFLLLSGCIIQIYFIHTYLFLHGVTGRPVLDFAVSMALIVGCALLLEKVTSCLRAGMQRFSGRRAI